MSDKLGPKAISTIKSVFLILFVDLMGFSIIFPLFPDLIDYYLETDRNNFLLSFIINLIGDIDSDFGRFKLIVLFGGIIGAIYSLLQYISSPFWGNLSDKIGRKTVLKITLMGTFFSYVVWIFSASFTVLVLSRVLSGLMSGNISVATACISDVTNEKNRSKGMAFVGIAFALGFILGPALGGIFSLVSFEVMPYMHKFSAVALVASLLSFINIVFIYFKFEETNKLDNNNSDKKIINPLKLLKPVSDKSLSLINYSYFIFIVLFSAMEFTLTFAAFERLSYRSHDNALMFVYIGFILIVVQGGFVRRRAHSIGELKMSLIGLSLLVPGFLGLSFFSSTLGLYLSLLFLAIASSLCIPTMTSTYLNWYVNCFCNLLY